MAGGRGASASYPVCPVAAPLSRAGEGHFPGCLPPRCLALLQHTLPSREARWRLLLGPQHVAPSPPCGRVSLPAWGADPPRRWVSGAACKLSWGSPPGRAARATLVWFEEYTCSLSVPWASFFLACDLALPFVLARVMLGRARWSDGGGAITEGH